MARRDLVISALYTAISLAWVYGALDSRSGLNQFGENDRMVWTSVAFLGLVHFVVGYLRPSVWMLLLPAILVAVAVPAGDFPTSRPEYPIWFGLALLAPLLVVATGFGMAIRRFASRSADVPKASIRSS
jgi:hypothetical protein